MIMTSITMTEMNPIQLAHESFCISFISDKGTVIHHENKEREQIG